MNKKTILLLLCLMCTVLMNAQLSFVLGDEEQFNRYNTLKLFNNSFTDESFGVNVIDQNVEHLNFEACKRAKGNKTGEAFYNLAMCYFKGIGTKINYKDAYKNFLKAAEKGYTRGMNAVGECLCKGLGCNADMSSALKWFQKSASSGDYTGMYLIGKYIQLQGRESEAKEMFEASKLGNENSMMEICKAVSPFEAITMLVDTYSKGDETSSKISSRILKDLAVGLENNPNNAYPMALRLLADYCYLYQSYDNGFKLYQQAAQLGDEPSKYAMFLAKLSGLGTNKDSNTALGFLNQCNTPIAQKTISLFSRNRGKTLSQIVSSLTAQQLNDYDWRVFALPMLSEKTPSAYFVLGYYTEKGIGFKQNYSKAIEYYTKSANNGFAPAQTRLGLCYDMGYTGAVEPVKAFEWYRKAAEQGYADAQCNLGYCYSSGNGVKVNQQQALNWYRKAADQNNVVAQYNVALAYDEGLGVKQDLSKAIEWYTKASNQGYAPAQSNLGYYYVKGIGVAANVSKGVELLRKAARQDNEKAKNILYDMGLDWF